MESSTYENGLLPIILHHQSILQENGWYSFFQQIETNIIDEKLIKDTKANIEIFPPPNMIFNAFLLTSFDKLKVVIIGQDPYHTKGAAMGLAFAHPDTHKTIQPSLKNIYKELISCGYTVYQKSGNLTKWAEQGIFLINTALTVQSGAPNSHKDCWKNFTKELLKYISKNAKNNLVVIMWGKPAQAFAPLFDGRHRLQMSPHPSPFSASTGFFGSKFPIKVNEQLREWKMEEIDWNLPNPDVKI